MSIAIEHVFCRGHRGCLPRVQIIRRFALCVPYCHKKSTTQSHALNQIEIFYFVRKLYIELVKFYRIEREASSVRRKKKMKNRKLQYLCTDAMPSQRSAAIAASTAEPFLDKISAPIFEHSCPFVDTAPCSWIFQ